MPRRPATASPGTVFFAFMEVAMTGRPSGLPLFEHTDILGCAPCLSRIATALHAGNGLLACHGMPRRIGLSRLVLMIDRDMIVTWRRVAPPMRRVHETKRGGSRVFTRTPTPLCCYNESRWSDSNRRPPIYEGDSRGTIASRQVSSFLVDYPILRVAKGYCAESYVTFCCRLSACFAPFSRRV